MKGLMLYIVNGAFTAIGLGTVFGAALQLFLGSHRFPDWTGNYIFMFWIMFIFMIAGVVIMLVARAGHDLDKPVR
ncbi:MAG: hypothetical protein HZA19_05740 [Nitrospirae bacterium]|nr:hypothetical protein [Nitrospirota bacterium]